MPDRGCAHFPPFIEGVRQMTPRQSEVSEMLKAGDDYATICSSLNIRLRALQCLLSRAGIARRQGRPRSQPQGNRHSLSSTGLI